MEMAIDNNVGTAELRRQHEVSIRRTAETQEKAEAAFKKSLAEARRKIVKLFVVLGISVLALSYSNKIINFFTPAAKIVFVQVRHFGEQSKLKQALAEPDSDLADITH